MKTTLFVWHVIVALLRVSSGFEVPVALRIRPTSPVQKQRGPQSNRNTLERSKGGQKPQINHAHGVGGVFEDEENRASYASSASRLGEKQHDEYYDDDLPKTKRAGRSKRSRILVEDEDVQEDQPLEEGVPFFEDYQDEWDNILIPNPELDSLDPDKAVQRLPEIFNDFKFWRDLLIFVVVVSFLDAISQDDYFSDY